VPPSLKVVRRHVGRAVRIAAKLLAGVLALTFVASVWGYCRVAPEYPAPRPVVNDVSALNPIAVAQVIEPVTTDEIVVAVRTHAGPISVGGARHSMGGQIATEGALHIDMRRFNRILAFSPAQKSITVQAGATWRQIQERIDSADLAVKIMQTYANFTVGGSLSVNAHGRYIGTGPLILSVRSLKLVLADGALVDASPTLRPELFYGAIGGYGGVGVITEATLDLAANVRVAREHVNLPIREYRRWFLDHVRGSRGAIFHNADIYPPGYTRVNAVTYTETADSVTIPDRLIPANQSYRANRRMFRVISDWPFGKTLREWVVDPALFAGKQVTWRNYEASYDVAELEPDSRARTTYVLAEYFVPVEQFDAFVPRMRDILRRRRVNVINVSIRHAQADPGSLLAWAKGEVFAFVIYYKQGTSRGARARVGVWSRELIDAALDVGGSYYLPYQVHATDAQFLRAYPRAPEFFALKRRVDPTNKFRNKLWDRYYDGLSPDVRLWLDTTAGYRRDEGQTFLTHPEWYIVYSSDEYAAYLKDRLPTDFPYVVSIGQYWHSYRETGAIAARDHPFNLPYTIMLWVIGISYSAELAIKGVYENTVGRFTGWTAGHAQSDEDRYAADVAADYGRFIHIRPWYEYRFWPKLRGLWSDIPFFGSHQIRKWERKAFLTLEYGVKALYATLIQTVTHTAYGSQDERMQLVVTGWVDSLAARVPHATLLARLDSVHTLLATPRYDAFVDAMREIAAVQTAVEVVEIAGNREIFLTGVASRDWEYSSSVVEPAVAYTLPLPTDPARMRFTMRVPVRRLMALLRAFAREPRAQVDHVYDY
jgi:FAD/FMN-containing dehydrogenase